MSLFVTTPHIKPLLEWLPSRSEFATIHPVFHGGIDHLTLKWCL